MTGIGAQIHRTKKSPEGHVISKPRFSAQLGMPAQHLKAQGILTNVITHPQGLLDPPERQNFHLVFLIVYLWLLNNYSV